ncbi:MAG: Cell division protein [uncultured Aureispira sp.]|uniref:Cell division protein n=1 Tax=uncultured Aureispira sp. TaxID=1331704 RepID=A0A6S6UEK2_9BACT|nr:MAG: Cell division protein [uncultured Aureispira sp.]
MPLIKIETLIQAPIQRCFDLSRSIDLHQISMEHTNEKAIAGRTSGLIQLGEQVTWQARHFGLTQKLTVQITAFDAPYFFADEMLKGAFQSFRHEHHFKASASATLMTDRFEFEAPLGVLGQIANRLFLTKYMKRLLQERNKTIQKIAESERWKEVL